MATLKDTLNAIIAKVNANNLTARIVDALTSTDATKVLSANQGKILKDAIDAKTLTLPIATASVLGGVKSGGALSVNATTGVCTLDSTNLSTDIDTIVNGYTLTALV